MGLSAGAVIVIALVASGAGVLMAYAMSHAYLRARNAGQDRDRGEILPEQRAYMSELRDKNKQAMMVENGYGTYRAPHPVRAAPGRAPVRPQVYARTDTEDSTGILG